MKFLKEMIARSSHAPDQEDASVVAFQDIIAADRRPARDVELLAGACAGEVDTLPSDPEWEETDPTLIVSRKEEEEDPNEVREASNEPAQDSMTASNPEDEVLPDISSARIWEMFEDDVDETPVDYPPDPAPEASENDLARQAMELLRARAVDDGAAPPAEHNGGRVKTRILGFTAPESTETDVFSGPQRADAPRPDLFPVGWLVVVKGPGQGASFPLFGGVSHIGRGEDQAVRLNFGDTSISRENHAAIAYDDEQNTFFVGHGGKANIVRLNGKPVLSTEELAIKDQIRIGETTLRFVALCDDTFQWQAGDPQGADIV